MPTLINDKRISPDMKVVLSWKEPEAEKRELYLRENETAQIGRDAGNDLYVRDEKTSRHHALITWKEGQYVLQDLGSTNGTKLNDQLVDSPAVLRDMDLIQIGDIEILFRELNEPAPDFSEKDQGYETFIVRQNVAQPRLITSAGPHEGKEYLLQPGKMVIGRATSEKLWDISLNDKSVSRPHAEISRDGDHFSITDLKSANGVIINGELISEEMEMQDGDVLVIGESTLLFRKR